MATNGPRTRNRDLHIGLSPYKGASVAVLVCVRFWVRFKRTYHYFANFGELRHQWLLFVISAARASSAKRSSDEKVYRMPRNRLWNC